MLCNWSIIFQDNSYDFNVDSPNNVSGFDKYTDESSNLKITLKITGKHT